MSPGVGSLKKYWDLWWPSRGDLAGRAISLSFVTLISLWSTLGAESNQKSEASKSSEEFSASGQRTGSTVYSKPAGVTWGDPRLSGLCLQAVLYSMISWLL